MLSSIGIRVSPTALDFDETIKSDEYQENSQ
jgi:hypothetical protein